MVLSAFKAIGRSEKRSLRYDIRAMRDGPFNSILGDFERNDPMKGVEGYLEDSCYPRLNAPHGLTYAIWRFTNFSSEIYKAGCLELLKTPDDWTMFLQMNPLFYRDPKEQFRWIQEAIKRDLWYTYVPLLSIYLERRDQRSIPKFLMELLRAGIYDRCSDCKCSGFVYAVLMQTYADCLHTRN